MDCPYPKPNQFSDPYMDWSGCEERLAAILAKRPEELIIEDYQAIFFQHLPVADYEEGCYYVPFYLDYLAQTSGLEQRTHEGFFWYIDHFADRFARDGLLTAILDRIWECFLQLTESFQIIRLTDSELESHGICPSYREIAQHARTVPQLLEPFIVWPVYAPLLVRFREHFDQPRSVIHAHWFMELAFESRTWLWLEPEPLEPYQAIFDFFHRLDRYRVFYKSTIFSPITEGFFEYNRRISPN